MFTGVQIRVIRLRKYLYWMLLKHHKYVWKSLKFIVFYGVLRFQNKYGCSILIAVCYPPEYFYLIIALAAEIQWHVVGAPSKRIRECHHSRAITEIMVGGWGILSLQVPAPNVHHGG